MENAYTSPNGTLPELEKSETHEDNDLTGKPKLGRMTASLNEDVSSEEERPLTDDGISKTSNESRVISIREAFSDSPSASGISAGPEALDTLTMREIERILSTGDLTRMHEIIAWTAEAIRKWIRKGSRQGIWGLAYALIFVWRNSDGASVDALTDLPHFHVFVSQIIINCSVNIIKDDPVFLAKVRDALLPHVDPEYETGLRRQLGEAIKCQKPLSILEFVDALWSKAILNNSNDIQTIKYLYSDIQEEHENNVNNASFEKAVIHIGISRHIKVLLDLINEPSYKDELDTFAKSELLEWSISSNSNINEIHVLRHIDTETISLVTDWNGVRQLFTSKISAQSRQAQSDFITDAKVSRILEQIAVCAQNCRTDEKTKAISWLLGEICEAMEEEDPGATWEPILVGSAAECTQALFIDEFDYLLLTNSTRDKHTLKVIESKLKNMHHPRLDLENMNMTTHGYPCLYIRWVDEHLRNTHITIDLVPARPMIWPVTLPHHNFLPVPREQQTDDGAAKLESAQGMEIADHDLSMPSTPSKNFPRLFTELSNRDTVFSQVENGLINALPSYIIEGYRLAKAVRITQVIQPIVHKLIGLGVTLDIHKIIRTYHLKTCVFYLTQHYVYNVSDIEGNTLWKWAIAIFEKLREFVMLGDVNEFFATDRYIFKGLGQFDEDYRECVHDEEDFTAPLPRFFCCRRRKARLLMVDQILRVLRESYERFNKADKSLE